MERKCVKCKESVNEGTSVMHAGKLRFLCNFCYDQVDNSPDSNTKVSDFLIMNKKEWIDRNIRVARENKNRGSAHWSLSS